MTSEEHGFAHNWNEVSPQQLSAVVNLSSLQERRGLKCQIDNQRQDLRDLRLTQCVQKGSCYETQ